MVFHGYLLKKGRVLAHSLNLEVSFIHSQGSEQSSCICTIYMFIIRMGIERKATPCIYFYWFGDNSISPHARKGRVHTALLPVASLFCVIFISLCAPDLKVTRFYYIAQLIQELRKERSTKVSLFGPLTSFL